MMAFGNGSLNVSLASVLTCCLVYSRALCIHLFICIVCPIVLPLDLYDLSLVSGLMKVSV